MTKLTKSPCDQSLNAQSEGFKLWWDASVLKKTKKKIFTYYKWLYNSLVKCIQMIESYICLMKRIRTSKFKTLVPSWRLWGDLSIFGFSSQVREAWNSWAQQQQTFHFYKNYCSFMNGDIQGAEIVHFLELLHADVSVIPIVSLTFPSRSLSDICLTWALCGTSSSYSHDEDILY